MALITCPVCGRQVSDQSKYCVHCGASLQAAGTESDNTPVDPHVCPECGGELPEGAGVCPHCGYDLPPAEEVFVHDYIEVWKSNEPQEAKRMKTFKLVSRILSPVSVILFFIVGFLVIRGLTSSSITLSVLHYVIVAFLLLFAWILQAAQGVLYTLHRRWTGMRCSDWLLKHGVDIKEYLRRNRDNRKKVSADHFIVAYNYYHPSGRKWYIALTVILAVFGVIANFLLPLAVIGWIVWSISFYAAGGTNFLYLYGALIIVFIPYIVVLFLIDAVPSMVFKSRAKKIIQNL